MESFVIRTEDLQLRPLRFNEAQEYLWTIIAPKLDRREKVWLMILKARQEGVSTFVEALILARTVLEDLVHSLIIAHETKPTELLWEMAELMIDQSPLKAVKHKRGTRLSLGRSYLDIVTAGSPEASRASNLTCLHGSEDAFWPDPRALTALMQTLPASVDTFCFHESTANGKIGRGAMFYEEWKRAVAGESDFIPVFLPWFKLPKYSLPHLPITELDKEERALKSSFGVTDDQLAWRRWCLKAKCRGDLNLLHQEFPATAEEAFVASGLPFFTAADLMPHEETIWNGNKYRVDLDGKLKEDAAGPITLFRYPQAGHQYVIGADSAMGILDAKHSRSAAEVIDMGTLEQVAEYDASVDPHIFAKQLVGLARAYHDAVLAPEVQSSGGGGGREVLVYIQQEKYYNLHRWKQVERTQHKVQKSFLLGWETNARSRPRMLARIREAIREKSATIHSRKLLQQLSDLGESDAGRIQALAGHDDLVFAWGIALMSRSENYTSKIPGAVRGAQQPDWKGMGIRVVDDLSNSLVAHREKIMKGRRKEADSYLEL